MKKIYLAGCAVLLLFILVYFLLPARQDMNKKVAVAQQLGQTHQILLP